MTGLENEIMWMSQEINAHIIPFEFILACFRILHCPWCPSQAIPASFNHAMNEIEYLLLTLLTCVLHKNKKRFERIPYQSNKMAISIFRKINRISAEQKIKKAGSKDAVLQLQDLISRQEWNEVERLFKDRLLGRVLYPSRVNWSFTMHAKATLLFVR